MKLSLGASVGLGLGGLIALTCAACCGSNQAPPVTATDESQMSPGDPKPATVIDATGTVWGAPDPPRATMGSSASGSAATTGPESSTGATASAGPPTDAELSKLNDEELAAVVEAVDDGEIRVAQLAEAQTKNPEVKRFAHDMLVGHQSMESQDKALLSGVNMAPTASAISNRLQTATQSEVAELTNLHEDAFDHAYVDMQVRDHNQAIDLFDRIISNVRNVSFKTHLTAARPKLQAHLRMAQSVQSSVEKGLTNRQANPDKR